MVLEGVDAQACNHDTWKAELGRLQVKICLDNKVNSKSAWVM